MRRTLSLPELYRYLVFKPSTAPVTCCLLVLAGCTGTALAVADARKGEAAPQVAVAESAPGTTSTASRRGELLFLQCRACHSLNREDGHRVGPNLAGLFGNVAGSREEFIYSDVIASSGLVWTEKALDEFLARPNDFFPGTKMAYAGLPNAENRRQLIAYIKSQAGE